jgi:hemoglobin-like flavoprotein
MTPEQITLVQSSFAKVEPIAATAAELFYARLFEIAPEVKPLFKGDMTEQGVKLMSMLGTVVRGLNRLDALVPAAQNLARAHVAYGVQPEHYAPVGAALLDTLAKGLGDAFTSETKAAWETAYGILSKTMIDAAYS